MKTKSLLSRLVDYLICKQPSSYRLMLDVQNFSNIPTVKKETHKKKIIFVEDYPF